MRNGTQIHHPATPSAAAIRGRLGELCFPRYVVAARIRLHPNRLSAVLQERQPLSEQLARRIWATLDEMEQEAAHEQ